jgi:hypothetical protein
MTNTFAIRSKLLDNNNLVLLAGVSGQATETAVDLFSITGTAAAPASQQWFGQGDPSGYFFIKSVLNESLVMNVEGASETAPHPSGKASLVDIDTQKQGWHQGQLWKFSLQSPEMPYLFIESALTAPNGQPCVLKIVGNWSEGDRPPTGAQVHVSPNAGLDSELWQIEVPAVDPPQMYKQHVTLPPEAAPVAGKFLAQINGTGFAPGWLSVGEVTIIGNGVATQGPQSNAGTVVNFDGTFETAVQLLPPAFELPSVTLHIFVQDSLGLPYGINATVFASGEIVQGAQGRFD